MFFLTTPRSPRESGPQVTEQIEGQQAPGQSPQAVVPPTTQSQNEQLLAQFAVLANAVESNTAAGPLPRVSVAIKEVAPGKFELELQFTESNDKKACEALASAVIGYVASQCPTSIRSVIRANEANAYLDLIGRKEEYQDKIHKLPAEINSLVSLVQGWGGDMDALATLLTHPAAKTVADLFTGPLVDAVWHAQASDVVGVADALSKAGFHEKAFALMQSWLRHADVPGSDGVAAVYTKFVHCLQEYSNKETFSATTTLDILFSLMDLPNASKAEGVVDFAQYFIKKHGSTCDPKRMIDFADLCAYCFPRTRIVGALALKAAFEGAVRIPEEEETAKRALSLLQCSGPWNRPLFKACQALWDEVDHGRIFDNISLRNLKANEFSFDLYLDPTGPTPSKLVLQGEFNPTVHANDLISHTQRAIRLVAQGFPVAFASPLIDVLLDHFHRLDERQQHDVYMMCIEMAGLAVQPDQATSPQPGPKSDPAPHWEPYDPANLARLQPQMGYSLLSAALHLNKSGKSSESLNAARWLLKNHSMFFGNLPEAALRRMLAAAEPGLLENPGHVVNAQSARQSLQRAIAPTIERLLEVFGNVAPRERVSRSPWLECLATLGGFGEIAALQTLVVRDAGEIVLFEFSQSDWEALKTRYEDARKALFDGVDSKADIADLLQLHRALIDSLVKLCRQNALAAHEDKFIEWAMEFIAAISAEDVLRYLGHPDAAMRALVGGLLLELNDALACESVPEGAAARFNSTLQSCAKPGVILDIPVAEAIQKTIQIHLLQGEYNEALKLLRLLYGSSIEALTTAETSLPLMACVNLLYYCSTFPAQLEMPEATIAAVVSALLEFSPKKALRQFDAWAETLPHHLACLGYLRIAKAYIDRGRKPDEEEVRNMLRTFARAMGYLQSVQSADARDMLAPYFQEFFSALQRVRQARDQGLVAELTLDYAKWA